MLAELPDQLVSEMIEAISTADLDLLVSLIKSTEKENPEFSRYLLALAENFDYDQLQKILTDKTNNDN